MTSNSQSAATELMLKVEGLTKTFGGLRAVHNIDLELHPGDLAGLIGPNGAGKTTIFNLITGVYIPTSGKIIFNGQEIGGLAPHVINQMGIARTFQNIRLFPSLTVLENVCIAYHSHAGYSMQDAVLRNGNFEAKEKVLIEKAQDFLGIFHLEDQQAEIARNLPYGQQRRLEIARALAADPKLLCLDEPAAGMNPAESMALMDLIHFIRDRFKLTILLIEHQMRVVMGVCEKITVMDFGEQIAYGAPQEIQSNPRVVEAYLGRGAAELSEKFRRSKAQ